MKTGKIRKKAKQTVPKNIFKKESYLNAHKHNNNESLITTIIYGKLLINDPVRTDLHTL